MFVWTMPSVTTKLPSVQRPDKEASQPYILVRQFVCVQRVYLFALFKNNELNCQELHMICFWVSCLCACVLTACVVAVSPQLVPLWWSP